ncbi:MAG: GTPase ObgE [Patescibacteria group bacterium]|nr:GTPase ObgE [Patescibacteria group bacterium]
MFSDQVEIKVKAGDGGDGIVSFAHEIFKEFGGPDGGDGGKGGDIIFKADPSLNTLYWFKTHKFLKSENGENGKNKKKRGRGGENLIIKVPVGTVVYDKKGEEIVDLDEKGKEFVIAKGGDGGFGNAHFVSSVRQAPKIRELGIKGEEKDIILELKLVADVGLIGLPNAGKSTLLSVITSAKPKIADYPFTTLTPNLGVVEGFGIEKGRGFVIADIPGLIEGASKGKGLGDEFLRHIERTRIILHLIDVNSLDLTSDFKIVSKELADYNESLLKKSQLVVITKTDTIEPKILKEKVAKLEGYLKTQKEVPLEEKKPFLISAVTHNGLKELVQKVEELLQKEKEIEKAEEEEFKTFTIEDVKKDIFLIQKEGKGFRVSGRKIERIAAKTDFQNPYSVDRLWDVLERTGIKSELLKKGAKNGDKIEINGKVLKFKE